MSVVAVTYTFAPNTLTKSSEANTNFADLVTYINTNAIVKDASLAFTAVPSGPATDPSSVNHLARKAYVDAGGTLTASVATSQTRNLNTYGDLPTVGPSVTMTPPPSGKVLVMIAAEIATDTASQAGIMSFELSGGNVSAPVDSRSVGNRVNAGGERQGIAHLMTGLAAVSTTFTAKYRVTGPGGGTVATFVDRTIIVMGLSA